LSLRNSWFAAAAVLLINYCDGQLDVDVTNSPPRICSSMVPLFRAGCSKNIVGIASLIGQPTSRGSVTVSDNGSVRVDVNYLSTPEDLTAFGASVRTTYKIMSSFTSGPGAIQQPCADGDDKECVSQSCPNLIKNYVDYTYNALRIAMPLKARKMKRAPASMLYPQFVEPAIADVSNTDYDIGTITSDDIFAAHHLAGTASIGTVVDSSKDFQVIGVNGLYVTDASMLPTTTRANPMATIMTLGRISGLKAVEAFNNQRL
jgi:choline dehydrogenase-like flavoprotein